MLSFMEGILVVARRLQLLRGRKTDILVEEKLKLVRMGTDTLLTSWRRTVIGLPFV